MGPQIYLINGKNIKRSPENLHDDYTPPWILIDKLPLIKNFTNQERNIKAFAYHMDNRTKIQTKNWNIMQQKKSWGGEMR